MGNAFQPWQQQCVRQAIFWEALPSNKWKVPPSAHSCKLSDYDQETEYGTECWLQCTGNKIDNTEISQSLYQVGLIDTDTRAKKITKYKLIRTCWINMQLMVTVSWTAPSLVTRHGITIELESKLSPCHGNMQIPHYINNSRCSHQKAKWYAMSSGIRKPSSSRPTINSNHYIMMLN